MIQQEEEKYYVYGFWHIYPTKDIVTKDDVKEITEFGNIDDTLAFIKKRSEENINITYCICRDRHYVEKELKGE